MIEEMHGTLRTGWILIIGAFLSATCARVALADDTPAGSLPVGGATLPPTGTYPAEAPKPDDPPPFKAWFDTSGLHLATHGTDVNLQPMMLGETSFRIYPNLNEGNTGFAMDSFRLGLRLSVGKYFSAVGNVEFANAAEPQVQVLDAYTTFRPNKWIELTAGYSKPPLFPQARLELESTLPFPDYSPVVSAFRIRRDLGVEAHFSPRAIPIEAIIRVSNGSGSVLGNDNAVPAGSALLDLVLGRAWTGSDPTRQTFGLRLGAGSLIEDVLDRNSINGVTPLGFTYFRPTVIEGRRLVGEAHLISYLGPVQVSFEGSMSNEARSKDDDGNPATPRVDLESLNSMGLSSEISWVVLGAPRGVGVPPGIRPSKHWNGGAFEVAGRFDAMWLGRSASDVAPGGSVGGALSMTWWPLPFFSGGAAGYVTHYDVSPIEEPTKTISFGMISRATFAWGQADPSSINLR